MRLYFTVPFAFSVALGLVVACGGEPSPADNCREFLDISETCAKNSGRTLPTNSAACDDPSVADPRTQAQMTCAIEHEAAYCATLIAGLSGNANPALARDPAVLKLNACVASRMAAEPCRAAILAMGDCGAAIGLANAETCTGQTAAVANCIVQNKAGACSLGNPNRTATTFTPDELAYQKCLVAITTDAGRD
ncbi:MAG: hypothetical protein JNM74_27880 [Myxococcales bacterium]|nr:hypothetical protein [Myxococcales bacterium]